MQSNANVDGNAFLTQMASVSRAPAELSHAHGRSANGFQSGFNPPTAPVAMRAGTMGGSRHYTPGSVQWRPNPLSGTAAVANDSQRRRGGPGVIGTAGLPDGWYR